LMAVLLGFSAFFSGSETALFNLTRGELRAMSESSGPVDRLIWRMMRRPDELLNTILFGNMLVNVAFATTSALVVFSMEERGFSAFAIGVFSIVPLILVILFGEVTPKVMAILIGKPWAVAAAPVLAAIQRIFGPIVRGLNAFLIRPLTRVIAYSPPRDKDVTGEELGELLNISANQGLIDRDISGMLQEIIELTDIRVADVMVPRVDLICYDVDASPEGLMQRFAQTGLRRMPVYEDNPDNIIGLVSAKRLWLTPHTPLRKLVRKALFVPETANLEQLLGQFRKVRRQMAIVVDEYGGTAGLVTLEDVLEEIVGDLPDASGEESIPQVERISQREYLVAGDLAIHNWADFFHVDLSAQRISTIGGFVLSCFGRVPQVGDVVDYQNLRFTVERMRHRRIAQVRLELQEVAENV
ncbi:MAG: hemolysin family protein, partial [Planctomycetota bacterium]